MKYLRYSLPVILILAADQSLKFWVKTHMRLGEEFSVIGDWFRFHFTENEGMAFGMTIGGEYGKLLLSIFRIVALILITWYWVRLIRQNAHPGFIFCISLILAGALGNIIDSCFYGILFSESTPLKVAEFLPEGGGYATFLHGKVVDMFYFPVYQGFLPEWVPFWGGKYIIFFRPVFNIADVAITVGVLSIIVFQKRFFTEEEKALDAQTAGQPTEEVLQETATTQQEETTTGQ